MFANHFVNRIINKLSAKKQSQMALSMKRERSLLCTLCCDTGTGHHIQPDF